MSEWKEYNLGDVLTFQRGHDLPKTEMIEGSYPVAGSNGIIGFHSKYTTKGPGITIGRSGSIGTPHFYKNDFWAHNTVLYVKDFKSNSEIFLFYLLKTLDFTQFNTGSAVPSLNRNHIHELFVKIPSLPEQKTIASILSSLDDKIDLLHRQNATLEKMAETLFRQWFIVEAKEEWEMGCINDICTHHKTSIQPQKNPTIKYSHYSIPSFDSNKNPSSELGIIIQSNKYLVPQYSILFSKLNPHKDKRIWLLQNEVEEDSICSTEFQVVLPKKRIHLYFIYGWLSFDSNYNEIASGAGGTSGSHQRIDPSTIFNFQCPIINDEYIEKYNSIVEPMYRKLRTNQTQIRTLTQLRDTLLPKLMSGEIRVSEHD